MYKLIYGVEIVGTSRMGLGKHMVEKNKRLIMMEGGLFDDVFILARADLDILIKN